MDANCRWCGVYGKKHPYGVCEACREWRNTHKAPSKPLSDYMQHKVIK